MAMTQEELASAQRMLKVLDEQIAVLKRRSDRAKRDWMMAPTDRQTFFYSSDAHGLMRFHSDSTFVAEQIFVYGAPMSGKEFLSIEDLSSGRGLTVAQEPAFVVPPDPTTGALDMTTKLDGIWIPPSAWCPQLPAAADTSVYNISQVWNFDHVATLETDFVVARGGVLRFRFRHSADGLFRPLENPTGISPLNYAVTLVGYKVY